MWWQHKIALVHPLVVHSVARPHSGHATKEKIAWLWISWVLVCIALGSAPAPEVASTRKFSVLLAEAFTWIVLLSSFMDGRDSISIADQQVSLLINPMTVWIHAWKVNMDKGGFFFRQGSNSRKLIPAVQVFGICGSMTCTSLQLHCQNLVSLRYNSVCIVQRIAGRQPKIESNLLQWRQVKYCSWEPYLALQRETGNVAQTFSTLRGISRSSLFHSLSLTVWSLESPSSP